MVLLRPQKTDHKSNMLQKDRDSWTDHVRKEEVLHRVKVKVSPITGSRCPQGSRKLTFPDYVTLAQNGGKFSPTHRPFLPPGNTPGTHFC